MHWPIFPPQTFPLQPCLLSSTTTSLYVQFYVTYFFLPICYPSFTTLWPLTLYTTLYHHLNVIYCFSKDLFPQNLLLPFPLPPYFTSASSMDLPYVLIFSSYPGALFLHYVSPLTSLIYYWSPFPSLHLTHVPSYFTTLCLLCFYDAFGTPTLPLHPSLLFPAPFSQDMQLFR